MAAESVQTKSLNPTGSYPQKRTRSSASRMAVSTRPNFERTSRRQPISATRSQVAESANNATRVRGLARWNPRMRLKSVNPLFPPNPVWFRKNRSMKANVSACVMMEK